jgi:hypothetical protein
MRRFWYKYHPLYGREVPVVRKFSTGRARGWVIDLGDDTTLGVPDWMLDDQACAEVVDSAAPRISLDGLRQLRQLLDSQQQIGEKVSVRSPAQPEQGATDAPTSTLSTELGISDRIESEQAARLDSKALPGADRATPDRGSQE